MDGRASLPNHWAPKGPRVPSIGQPHGREPRKTNHGYRDTGMNLRTKTGGKPMYSEEEYLLKSLQDQTVRRLWQSLDLIKPGDQNH